MPTSTRRGGTRRHASGTRTQARGGRGTSRQSRHDGGGRSGSRRERNPYAEPRGDRRGRGRGRGGPSKQSGAGVFSAICGGVTLLCFFAVIAAAASMVNSAMNEDTGGAMASAGMALIFVIVFWISMITGIITGFIGLMAENRKKGMAITGLIINGLFGLLWLGSKLASG